MARFKSTTAAQNPLVAPTSRAAAPVALQNPIGYPKPPGVDLVRVGTGEMVHVKKGSGILCNSGKNAGRKNPDGSQTRKEPQYFATDATQVTCYRCSKLLSINEHKKVGSGG